MQQAICISAKYGKISAAKLLPSRFTVKRLSCDQAIGRLHVTSRISRQKKWMTKSSNLCWGGIGRTPTFGVILKTNEKLIKIWNELLLVGFSETNKFDQKQFG